MDRTHEEHLGDLSIEAQYELKEGDPARAVEICRTLVEEWTRIQGPEGERVLVWRGFLGRSLLFARQFTEAEQVLSDLVVDRTRIEGPDATGTLVARGNLARAVSGAGRPQEAALLAERLIADRERVLGPDHPSTFDARGHLAHILGHLGDSATSAEHFAALLADRERVLGPDHPDTLTTATNLAVLEARATGAREAVDELRDDVAACEREFGPEHPSTLDAVVILAEQLLRAADPDRAAEALALAERAVVGRTSHYGATDPRTRSAELTRSRCLLALRMRSEALASLTALIDRADGAGLTGDLHALVARADLILTLAEWLASGLAPDEVVETIRVHHTVLVREGVRLEPDHYVREITDEITEVLEAVDAGTWFDDVEEDE